jgi:hypothetical protein
MSLISEEDAKTKWCPKARAGDERGEGRIPVNRSGNFPDSDCFCMASACMAWRWEGYRPANRDGDKRGYCGAFGIPLESAL